MGVSLALAIAGAPLVMRGFAADGNAAPAAREGSTLAGPKEKLSYALGMVLGTQFRKQSVEIDPDLYHRGMKDALAGGGTLMSEADARSIVAQLQAEMKKKQAAATTPTGTNVSFLLDPRLTQGSYMGERWVSPPTYTMVQEGNTCTVEARVPGVASKGKRKQIRPRWIPSDPGMVSVSPSIGTRVKITVRRDGESKLKVALPMTFRELTIKAAYQDNTIRVDISQ
jgi:hypothetical protein